MQVTHPYKDWNAIRPYVDHLRNFTLRAFTHISKHEGKKLDPKARECIFWGYGYDTKGYLQFDCERKKIMFSRDLHFNENEFRSQQELSDGMDQKLVKIQQSCDEEDLYEESGTPLRRQSTSEEHPPTHLGVTVANDKSFTEPTTVRQTLSGLDAELWSGEIEQGMNSLK